MTTVSAIIPAYRARATLPLVLSALEPQVIGRDREVVLVDSAAAEDLTPLRHQWPWVRVISTPHRMLPGQARNVGASLARGELLASLDADAVPQSGWIDELERAMIPDVEMVAGAVLDGTPQDRWGTAGYALEFLEWVPDRQTPLQHAASCNLLVRRSSFERVRGFPEDLWPGEDTVFTFPFAARGTLAFAPRARVTHLNRVERREVLAHQRRLGASWVQVCARVPIRGRQLGAPRLAPLAVAARVLALVRQLRREPRGFRRVETHGPMLMAGLLSWGLGMWHATDTRVPESGDSAETQRA